MTALSAGRVTPEYDPFSADRTYPIDALSQIWEGGIVVLDTTGYAAAGTSTTSLVAVGVAQQSKLGGATDGATSIEVHEGVFKFNADSAFAATTVGGDCYIVDDNTVSVTATNRSRAGTVCAVDGSYVWVGIGIMPPASAAAVTSLSNNLGLTTSPGGASYVGVYDTATIYTATDVEAALAEVMKKANAGLAGPSVFSVVMSSMASLTPFTFYPQQAGKIARIDAFMRKVATTSASVTLQAYISAAAVTGGVLTLNSTACGTLGAVITGSAITGSNSFTSTQAITLKPAVTTAFTEGEMEILVFFASA